MNFATLKSLTIPEGVVKQIADASGRVIWSAAKPVKVTVTAESHMIYAQMTVNGVTYHLPDLDGKKEVLTLPIGAEIVFTNTGTRVSGDVYINHADGTKTTGSFSKNGGTYVYKVIGYANIEAYYTSKSYGPGSYDNAPVITITEIPEGHALVNITASGAGISANFGSVTIDGTVYASSVTTTVPIGEVIKCAIKNDNDTNSQLAYIEVNGTTVKSAEYGETANYNYTVVGNVTISLSYNKGRCSISITET